MQLDRPDDVPVIGVVDSPDLHCMTLNVRRDVPHRRADHPDAWSHRREALADLVATERPHVLALQEVLPTQADWLTARIGPRWQAVLVGRGAHGGGERVGLLIDSARLRVTGRRSWALSRHPGRPGSRSWGTLFPRIAVGAELEDRETGVRFLALATHLDHLSAPARLRSARLIGRIAGTSDLPTVALADWNAPAGAAPDRALERAGFADTWRRARRRETPEYGTWTRYRQPRIDGHRIDRILARPTDALVPTVSRAAISGRRPGGVSPSDHAAVHAVLRWTAVGISPETAA